MEGVGLSLDGSSGARHDSIRGVPGTFDRTLLAMHWTGELGLPMQINTLVSEETAPDLPAIFELLKNFKIVRWSLFFFLISVGRGKCVLQLLTTDQAGRASMGWVYEISKLTHRRSWSRPPRRRLTGAWPCSICGPKG